MAIQNNAAREIWNNTFEPEIFARLGIAARANRRFEQDLQMHGKAYKLLDTTNYATTETAITAANRYTLGTYNHSALVEAGADSEDVQWNYNYKGAVGLTRQQRAVLTADQLIAAAQRQARSESEKIEDRFITLLQGADLSAVNPSFRADQASTTESNVFTVGAATNYIDDNGVFQGGSADQDTFLDELRAGLLTFARRKIHGITGENERRMMLAMGPTLWYNIITAVEDKGADALILADLDGNWRGTLYGYYDIMVHADLDADVTVSSKKQKQAYAFSAEALTYAQGFGGEPKIIDPDENQDSWNWELHQIIDCLVDTDDLRFLYRFNVRNEA